MIRFLIASHGRFASGIKTSLDILMGSDERISTIDAYISEDNVSEMFEDYFDHLDPADQLIMLSDLYGGSVNQIMYRYLDRENTYLISGVNLPFVLEIVARSLAKDHLEKEEIQEIIEQARAALKYVDLDTGEETQEDEFF